jgi:hypothetical protein
MGSNWKLYHRRGQIVEQARQLARSGQHKDHTSILPLLALMDGYEAARQRLEERAVRAQLDQLCIRACNSNMRAPMACADPP